MSNIQKIVLITGAARRIGADIAKTFHAAGFGVVVHYHTSNVEAEALAVSLNGQRKNSAWTVKADLQSVEQIGEMVNDALVKAGRLDVLVNNASTFYETPIESATEQQWDDLMGCNLKAPFFVSQAALSALKESQGCIVNLVDIYAKRALPRYPIYSVAKAGLSALTESLAKELAPTVRVNGVSPGVILWPEDQSIEDSEAIVNRIPLQRQGSPNDIAETVLFLAKDAHYITGQVIAVDGGKSLV
ncbi:MAG TPA: pteridine reductase [Cycloclasticus sp.]|jgi:pteridine reductase|nr:pteridine reductase [Cycloclasticus sp.]